MNDPGCGLVWVTVWLAFVAYQNYKIWARPDEQWHKQRGRSAWARNRYRNSILGLFGLFVVDPWGFENNRNRFIWFYRIGFGLFLLLGMILLIADIGAVQAR